MTNKHQRGLSAVTGFIRDSLKTSLDESSACFWHNVFWTHGLYYSGVLNMTL